MPAGTVPRRLLAGRCSPVPTRRGSSLLDPLPGMALRLPSQCTPWSRTSVYRQRIVRVGCSVPLKPSSRETKRSSPASVELRSAIGLFATPAWEEVYSSDCLERNCHLHLPPRTSSFGIGGCSRESSPSSDLLSKEVGSGSVFGGSLSGLSAFLGTLPARPRVDALAAAGACVLEVARVAVGPARIAPRRDDPVPGHYRQRRRPGLPAGIADTYAEVILCAAGLDPTVAPTAEGAGHQFSSGRRMVVTDPSASVMIQTFPARVS